MLKITDKTKCCGCGACENICPQQCIRLQSDEEGFLYPVIDMQRCVDCDACVRVCPVLTPPSAEKTVINTYGAVAKEEGLRAESSSGGIFSLLARHIFREGGGCVFGAAFDNDFQVRHICSQNDTELEKLRGSKYVQSTIDRTYCNVKQALLNGMQVLFSGTPCQVAGLKKFLGKDYDNLVTIDFICHGVPSPLVWKKYLEYQSRLHHNEQPTQISFRNKKYGWRRYSVSIVYSDGTEYSSEMCNDAFMQAFLSDICLRPSCYQCRFKAENRVSDLTIADFWGIEKVLPALDDDKGASLVIVRSQKGAHLINAIADQLYLEETDLSLAAKWNPSLYSSASQHPRRKAFMNGIAAGDDFQRLVDQYCKANIMQRLIRKTKKIIKHIIGR